MPALRRFELGVLDQARPSVLLDGLEDGVAGRHAGRFLRGDERLVDQLTDEVDGGAGSVAAADSLRGVEGEAARKHGQPPEDALLVVVEEPVAPVHRRPEGFVAGLRRAAAAGEDGEAVLELGEDLVRRHHPGASGGELDGEWDALDATADSSDCLRVFVVESEGGLGGAEAVGEKAHGLLLGQRADPHDRLAVHAQGGAAGGEEAHAGTVPEELVGELDHGRDQVLAVVDHEQRGLVAEPLCEGLGDGPAGLLADAERFGGGLRHQLWLAERRELDQPDAVLEAVDHVGGRLEREAGLARAAGADEGEHAAGRELLLDLRELGVATDEAGRADRQVVAARVHRPERRKFRAEISCGDLEDPLRALEVAEAVPAEVAELDPLGQAVDREVTRRLGQEDLVAVRGREQARAAVDRGAVIVARAKLRLAAVDGDADVHVRALGPRLCGELALHRDGAGHGVGGARESGEHAVALAP